jgi:hypothetical protein
LPPKKTNSRKRDALRQQGCWNPRPEQVTDPLFQQSDFFDADDLLQVKYEMLRRVRIDQKPVSQAAAAFGFSRPTYYQAELDFQQQGLFGLLRVLSATLHDFGSPRLLTSISRAARD